MPKIIPNVRKKILTTAKKHLFEKGYGGLILRELADQCEIAVGTIYNYFSSKDMLVASIMAEDWLISLKDTKTKCKKAATVEEGVRAIHDAIVAYVEIYEKIWTEYKGMLSGFGDRHVMLRSQLSEILSDLIIRLGRQEDIVLCPLLAETVLACAMQKDIDYPVLAKMVKRLFL